MTTFFTILFIILGVNLVMMFFNLSGTNQKAKKSSSSVSDATISKIHPIDLISSKYKKAV
ncbi:hypothetical protein [Maribacter sp. 2308TA10-17]|uniref:hypothetical protein n=1 Tax=Maribacter sp. 2308TA10-17 TaxID=3386276 RepID=UPI0039BC9806